MIQPPGGANRTFSHAGDPRRPQPMTPTLIKSLPAAWAVFCSASPLASTPAVAAVVLRKSRRDASLFLVMERLLVSEIRLSASRLSPLARLTYFSLGSSLGG